jgi:hypothetical protein
VRLHAKLEGLIALWRTKAEEKGLTLQLDIDPQLPALIRTDSLRLQQVVSNLLSNALKFTETGGVQVNVDVLEAVGGPRLSVSVADTGCGISAEALTRVFASFEQARPGRRGATAARAWARHQPPPRRAHGRLADRRERTRRRLSLHPPSSPSSPPRRPPPRRPPRSVNALQDDADLSILVAEDHEVNRRILTLMLQPEACMLTFATERPRSRGHGPARRVRSDPDGHADAADGRPGGRQRPSARAWAPMPAPPSWP